MKFKQLLLILLIIPLVFATGQIEECKGTVDTDELPCQVLLPYNGDCTTLSVSFYNATEFIYQAEMGVYSPFKCNATFNETSVGTYVFNYTTGDSGSIIVEEGVRMSFFNLTVYLVFMGVGLLFIAFMHIFDNVSGAKIAYGSIASAIFFIVVAMLASGFEVVRNITFIVDINYYIIFLTAALGLYTAIISYNTYTAGRPTD